MHPRLRRLLIALLAAASTTATVAESQRAAIQTRIDTIFNRWTWSTPGCAVGAAVNGEPVVRAAYGMADLEHDVPITPDTIFEAGSVSKQFTAAAVLLLERDGKLSLDDPVRRYIPELPDFGVQVTIRQMLHHTSGLRDWGNLAALAGWPRGSRLHGQADVLDILSRQHALNFLPGTHWSYSNSGYNLAAILVSRVSGMSFADYTRKRIFEPLGMRDTSWRDDYTRIVKRRAVAYSERQGTFATDMPFENVYGNGGLLTTVGDLLKWNENFASQRVGDATFVADLQRPGTFNDGHSYDYALGLYVDTYKGIRQVGHSGNTAGYRAHLVRYPDQRVSVAVLCNVSSANATTYASAVAELFLTGLRTAPPASSHTLTETEAARLAGFYRATQPNRVTTILRDKDGLRLENGNRLVAMSATHFETGDGMRFDFDEQGQMQTTDTRGTIDFYERFERARPSAERLKDLIGRYASDEIETTLNVVVDGDRLLIQRRPDSTFELKPVYTDGFSSALGWVTFRRDASGRVIGLSVSQDRVWDLRFTKERESATTTPIPQPPPAIQHP
jgi:CubicO group peptidase (beta-lactamase class C family)